MIRDWYLRRRAALHLTPMDKYRVRIARTVADYQDAFRLLYVAYVYQGIEPIRGVEMRIIPHHVLPEATVFVVYEGDALVGTMTATLDSPAGLPLDNDYPEELAALRQQGARIVEFGALAVVRRCWHTGVTALLNMAAHWFSHETLGATHCVCGIHPKTSPFYSALYAFEPLGAARPHAELSAPVLGMVHRLDEVRDHLRRHFRKPMATGLSPAEHFTEHLPPCIHMPPVAHLRSLARWKLSREVFRELFIDRSDRLQTLDDRTREHLEGWRSLRTMGGAAGNQTLRYGVPALAKGTGVPA